jgi:DNA-binding MarR family transcriptional regulator
VRSFQLWRSSGQSPSLAARLKMKRRKPSIGMPPDEVHRGRGLAFLASQVGAHSSRLWNQRLRAADLDLREVMLFWNVALDEGRSQRALADALGLPSSRVVNLVDALEARGWLERRTDSSDRRSRRLYLTIRGKRVLDRIKALSTAHEDAFTAGLRREERAVLVKLLSKVAGTQGLIATVHPDSKC